jgi:hypothetical protein
LIEVAHILRRLLISIAIHGNERVLRPMSEVPCNNDGDKNGYDSNWSNNLFTCGIHVSSPQKKPTLQKQSRAVHTSSQKTNSASEINSTVRPCLLLDFLCFGRRIGFCSMNWKAGKMPAILCGLFVSNLAHPQNVLTQRLQSPERVSAAISFYPQRSGGMILARQGFNVPRIAAK